MARTRTRTRTRTKIDWGYARRFIGFSVVAAGGGLMLEHYINYGFLLHVIPFDHGLVGLVLIVIGGLAAAGKPGQSTRS